MHEVVTLMDVPDGQYILLQKIQIVGSSQGNVLGEAKVMFLEKKKRLLLFEGFSIISLGHTALVPSVVLLLSTLDPCLCGGVEYDHPDFGPSAMGHSGDGCDLASTLCKYDLRKGDLFVLSWARVQRVRWGSIS